MLSCRGRDVTEQDSVLTVTANVDLDNPASIRVLEKSGLALCAQNQDQATYHIRRPCPGVVASAAVVAPG